MEEHVGALWHRFITRLADDHHADAAVNLSDLQRPLGIFFRALGGDGGLQIEAADATAYQHRRNWLQRIAGSAIKIELAWRDQRSLRLPPCLSWFAEQRLNHDLYYWLAAQALGGDDVKSDWFCANQRAARHALQAFPGLRGRYRRLVEAHLQQRPDPAGLTGDEAGQERAIRQALQQPGSIDQLPVARYMPSPVPLWLHPDPPVIAAGAHADDEDGSAGSRGKQREPEEMARRQAERVDQPEAKRGMIGIRMENILTMGEFVRVDRGSEDEEDLERAEGIARELDKLSVSRRAKSAAATIRFDLDLPGAAEDDLLLSTGELLPEWDWRKHRLQPDHCRIHLMLAHDAEPSGLPDHLKFVAKRLRNQFQALAPARVWQRARPEGQEIDIDAYLRYCSDRLAGMQVNADNLFRQMNRGGRDLSCLLMADLSLSTDSWINDHHRVIDVIRDSLYLFAESLAATGDPFAIFGFSSRKRDPVRVHRIKDFNETHGAGIRGRIGAIKPGYYTRMGAAIRYGIKQLEKRPEGRRLLLLLTDGKPNDIDQYEGRYGIEDSRQAVIEARHAGLEPFCVTIDKKANDYLPYLFSSSGYVVIRKPSELPAQLPLLYARLTA